MRFLRKNTAVIVSVGPFYDKTDGVTIENALTITNERVTLIADTDDGSAPTIILDNVTGATSGTDNDLNYITNCDAGMMQMELSAANTNRNGRLLLSITDAANHVPVFHEFTVLDAAVYDSLILGTDKLAVDAQEISSDATAADNAELMFDGTGYAGGTTKLGVDVVNWKGSAAPAMTGDAYARLGAPAGASVSADIADIEGKVDDLEGRVIGTIAAGTHNPQSGDAYARLGAPAGASVSADVAAVKAQTAAIEADTQDLQTQVGTDGAGLTALPWNAAWDAEVQSEATDALNAYDPPTKAELDTAVANVSVDEIQATALADLFNTDSGTTYASAVAGSPVKEIADNAGGSGLTTADIADAVWDEATSGHTTAGSTGAALSAAGSAGDPWSTALPGAYGAGTAGKLIGDNLDAAVSSRAEPGDAMALEADAVSASALSAAAVDEILDEPVEGTITLRQAMRIVVSALAGLSTGGGTSTVTFRDVADAKARITATVDSSGNRTSITLDGS